MKCCVIGATTLWLSLFCSQQRCIHHRDGRRDAEAVQHPAGCLGSHGELGILNQGMAEQNSMPCF